MKIIGVVFTLLLVSIVLGSNQMIVRVKDQKDGIIPFNIANFGFIPYGKEMTGEIIIANPMTNCEIEDDIADDNEAANKDRFLLILRGQCKFVTKVRNAQSQYAKLAIIMDNTKSAFNGTNIIMATDGHSRDIEIPSIFIQEKYGNKIIEVYQKDPKTPIRAIITFPTIKQETPTTQIFLDANNRGSYMFVRQFYKYMKDNFYRIETNVYHNFYTCFGSMCDSQDCNVELGICALPPVGDRVGRGLDVIKQSLRQYFAVKVASEKGFQYISLIDQHCIDYTIMQQCSNKQLKKVGIQLSYMTQQMNNITNCNQYLKKSIQMKQSNHIAFYPDIIINNVTYYGQLSGLDVFQMICNSFKNAPQKCNSYLYDYIPPKKKSLNGWTILAIVVISLLVFFIIMLCICRRYLRRRESKNINDEINQLVNHYITNYETKRIETGLIGDSVSETEASK